MKGKETIKLSKDLIQYCLNKSIKQFYACENDMIFNTYEEAQIHASKMDKSLGIFNIWFFWFDKNMELSGFSVN